MSRERLEACDSGHRVAAGIPVLEIVVSTRPGGGPEHVRTLARGLRRRGWMPVIAGPRDGALFDAYGQAGFETVQVRTDTLSPVALVRLAWFVRARGIRLVHSHGKGAGLYGRLVARTAGVPAIHSFHGIHYERYPAPVRALYLALERALARWTVGVVNVSSVQEVEGLRLGLFGRHQSRVVPNGVDIAALRTTALARDAARRTLGVAGSGAVVGSAARFDPVKGLELLVHAMATVDGAALALIGDGPEMSRLRALAAPLRERVRLVGEVSGAAALFGAFDVYAAPSAKEGMPLAVLEAMALGIPIVASDIPAHREILGDYPALVARTPDAFAAAIRRALGDEPWRAQLVARLLARASAFDAEQMADAIDALYREVLDARARLRPHGGNVARL
jgi:glycosyltransferase involved in cell wall biosynthesis